MAEYKTNLMNTHLPIVTTIQQQTQNTFERYFIDFIKYLVNTKQKQKNSLIKTK